MSFHTCTATPARGWRPTGADPDLCDGACGCDGCRSDWTRALPEAPTRPSETVDPFARFDPPHQSREWRL